MSKGAGQVQHPMNARWQRALQALQCEPNAQQLEQLQAYLALLQRWNKVYNLTAVRDPEQMLPLHLWDSLSVLGYIPETPCLDVGSGAGLPGIPLAIMRPDQAVTMLDTNGKKTRFIQQAIAELGLQNAQVVQARVEAWQPGENADHVPPFRAIVSRAFASLQDFITVTAMHLQDNGTLFAMKGRYPDTEIADLPAEWAVRQVHELQVPELDAERHLIELTRI